jgi:enoyl-CoA hydratase
MRIASGAVATAKVRYERTGSAAVLTIARPERRNAVDVETAGLLLDGLRRFEDDDGARTLILTGEGPEAFCAGADLKAISEAAAAGVDAATLDAVAGRAEGPMGFTRLTPSKPTIAAISGWCLAGGLELALWCDLRIATDSARLGYTERRFGVPLIDGGTQRLPLVVGMGRALELILTGRVVDAREALAWGLVNEVVAAGAHLDRALEIAEGLARFPQETMLSDRRAAIEGAGRSLAEGLALEAELGRASIEVGLRGAGRFAAGEGRGAEGAGV